MEGMTGIVDRLWRWSGAVHLQTLHLIGLFFDQSLPPGTPLSALVLPNLTTLRVCDGPMHSSLSVPNVKALVSQGFDRHVQPPLNLPTVERLVIIEGEERAPAPLTHFFALKTHHFG